MHDNNAFYQSPESVIAKTTPDQKDINVKQRKGIKHLSPIMYFLKFQNKLIAAKKNPFKNPLSA